MFIPVAFSVCLLYLFSLSLSLMIVRLLCCMLALFVLIRAFLCVLYFFLFSLICVQFSLSLSLSLSFVPRFIATRLCSTSSCSCVVNHPLTLSRQYLIHTRKLFVFLLHYRAAQISVHFSLYSISRLLCIQHDL